MRFSRFPPGTRSWTGALVLALLLLAADSAVRLSTIRAVTAENPSGLPPLEVDAASPSGWAWHQHRLVLPSLGIDGYHWILHTERARAGEGARIRASAHDNAPKGREVHWSGALRWWTAGLAWAWERMRPGPAAPGAVERVAPWANTLLLALLLVASAPLVARRFGSAAAAVYALGAVTAYPFYEYFSVGYFDHHGLATLLAAWSVLCLAAGGAGWTRSPGAPPGRPGSVERTLHDWLPSPRGARRWFLASAAAAAAGLWISAATLVPVMAGVGLALVAVLAGQREPHSSTWRFDAGLWRTWGLAGGAVAILLWLVEYFPGHLGARLEVNHPLYALAWVGAGDLLCRAAARLRGNREGPSTPEPAQGSADPTRGSERGAAAHWILLDAAAVALLPAVILLTRESTFVLADPFLWALHRERIVEFLPLAAHLERMGPGQVVASVGALPLLAPALAGVLWPVPGQGGWRAALWRGALLLATAPAGAIVYTAGVSAGAGRGSALLLAAGTLAFGPVLARRTEALLLPWRSVLGLTFFPAALLLGMALSQVRFLGIASALWLAALVVVASSSSSAFRWTPGRRWGAAAFLLAVLLPFPLFRLHVTSEARRQPGYPEEMVVHLATRDVSHWLRARLGGEDAVVLAGPTSTTLMAYFGGLRGVGTLYWENLEGLQAAAEMYAAATPEEARELLSGRGVTHVVSFPWDRGFFLEPGPGGAGVREVPGDAFLPGLLSGLGASDTSALPPWLVPLPIDLPSAAALGGGRVHVLEVVPQLPRELALVRLADYHLALGEPDRARAALESSLAVRENVPALARLARVLYVEGDAAGVARAVGRLGETVDSAGELELGDRIGLAVAYGLAGEPAGTRRVLEDALASADERSLRRLSPENLTLLLGLSRQMGLAERHGDVLDLALRLLPLPARAEVG